ncbi:hypothetical protein [Variovorax sp. HJSM1_2]|uniref:hypothetical protein n=1 Tax=Variovorax sp. HJSM1_2 TaxID=3366263 RepID=UPI003BBBA9CC
MFHEANKAQQITATALTFGVEDQTTKSAALLFKYVTPLINSTGIPFELIPPFLAHSESLTGFRDIEHSILEALFLSGYESLIEKKMEMVGYDGHPIYQFYHRRPGKDEEIDTCIASLVNSNAPLPVDFEDTHERTFRDFLFSVNFKSASASAFGFDLLGEADKDTNDVLVTLVDVPWVNLSTTPWAQIMEFRKDTDAVDKFRAFRQFVRQNYSGKSPTFIEDDLLTRLRQFEAIRKKHGFELQNSVVRSVLNSKYIAAGGLGGIMAWLFGNIPDSGIAGSAALLAGVAVEVANVGLTVRSANFELKQKIDGAELSYVIAARDRLGAKIS